MNDAQREAARLCFHGAESNNLNFPTIVGRLIAVGFERYAVDFCRAQQTYYLPDGDSVTFEAPRDPTAIGTAFDAAAVQAAVLEAQRDAPDYTYAGFRAKVMRAGCVGYVVSFPGKRVVYSGRAAEAHVENFPQ